MGIANETKNPKWMTITGWVITILVSLALLMSGVMKIIKPEMDGKPFADAFIESGWPLWLANVLAALEIGSVIVFLIPRTAVTGAILCTGYMGGAIAAHVRLEEPPIAQVIIAMLFWLALYFRDARIRALIPLRSMPRQVS